MADEQLTVAEILARAQKENPDAGTPKRRRRRSLEEGGISVAELTGSFKKVDSAPPEAKHSAIPIDDPDKDKAEAERRTKADEKAARAEAETLEAEQAEAEALKKAEEDAAKKAEAAAQARRAEDERRIEAERRLAQQAAEQERARKAQAADKAAQEKAQQEAEAQAAQEAPTQETTPPSADDTAVLERVEDVPEPQPQKEAVEDFTGEIPTVSTDGSTAASQLAGAEPQESEGTWDEHEAEARPNYGAVIGLALVGVVLGVIVFLGFEVLWSSMNPTLVAILAVAVTVIMVVVIRAMRTTRDGLSMALAALVGLVVTFGPAIVAL